MWINPSHSVVFSNYITFHKHSNIIFFSAHTEWAEKKILDLGVCWAFLSFQTRHYIHADSETLLPIMLSQPAMMIGRQWTPPTYITGGCQSTINDALVCYSEQSVSLHIISIPEVLPGSKVYLHCHNNTVVQMGCMKYEMKRERHGIPSDMLGFRRERIASLALFTVRRQNKSWCWQMQISFQSVST